jgi:hypothetical protein
MSAGNKPNSEEALSHVEGAIAEANRRAEVSGFDGLPGELPRGTPIVLSDIFLYLKSLPSKLAEGTLSLPV